MNIQPSYFDIETTGLAADDEVICFSYAGVQIIQDNDNDEKDILLILSSLVLDPPAIAPVVTYFGEPKYGHSQGFDMPMIRTRYLANGIGGEYPFAGLHHTDVSELVKKYFNTKSVQEPDIAQLSASQVTDMMIQFSMLPAKTKEANMRQLKSSLGENEINEYVIKNVAERKVVEHNSLDTAYNLLVHDPTKLGKDEFEGHDMPRLFNEYKKTGEPRYLGEIKNHNAHCVLKLRRVFEVCTSMLSPLNINQTRL
ncbi:MAG: hypothetical protein KAJ24_06665 [Candidatus Aenigmarchaeota archaeon]|nr:hypothetical protein [Candidatus Aenigmarchaeota archaeon]